VDSHKMEMSAKLDPEEEAVGAQIAMLNP
jgi:hypothetical protein